MAEAKEEKKRDIWYLKIEGQVRGPYNTARVRHFLMEGEVKLEDEVSKNRKDWYRISRVPAVIPLQFKRDSSVDEDALRDQEKKDRIRAFINGILVFMVVGGFIVVIMMMDAGRDDQVTDCQAVAAPNVKWENCRLDGSNLQSANLTSANMVNTKLINAKLGEAVLEQADMRFVDLSSADLSYAHLKEADLKGATLRNADLTYADFTSANLSHADFMGAKLGGAEFDQANLDGAIWIDGKRCLPGSIGKCVTGN